MITYPNILVLPIIAVPAVLAVMARFGLISDNLLVRLRRYAIFGFFAVAAAFTPPNALSQVIVALALIGLYEISIWCMRAAL